MRRREWRLQSVANRDHLAFTSSSRPTMPGEVSELVSQCPVELSTEPQWDSYRECRSIPPGLPGSDRRFGHESSMTPRWRIGNTLTTVRRWCPRPPGLITPPPWPESLRRSSFEVVPRNVRQPRHRPKSRSDGLLILHSFAPTSSQAHLFAVLPVAVRPSSDVSVLTFQRLIEAPDLAQAVGIDG